MNIDIINKQVAAELNLPLKDVTLINKYYWQRIRQHVYSYNPRPLNIMNVCVLFHTKQLNKKAIKLTIKKLRSILKSRRFKEGSPKRLAYAENYRKQLRHLLAIRKYNKYTN